MPFFNLLKIGGFLNLYFLGETLFSSLKLLDFHFLLPAQIFFIVSAFRCFFPVHYTTNVVLHNSYFSSIFFTRVLATFSEIAYIYQFSYLIRFLNANQMPIIDLLSWLMVIQVIISQFFVWGAILTGIQKLYFYEEFGWAIIFIINTILNSILFFLISNISEYILLIQLNLVFGIIYLPWQFFHLKSIKSRYQAVQSNAKPLIMSWAILKIGLIKAIKTKEISCKVEDWGGTIGMTWMISYWGTIIPIWIYVIINSI